MTKRLYLIIIAFILTSCSNVDFDNYFPSDQKQLDKMNFDFIGKYYYMDSVIGTKDEEQFFNSKYYLSTVDNHDSINLFTTDLIVTDKLVTYTIDFAAFYKIDKVDTSRLKKKFKYKDVFIKDKYLIHKEKYTDTLLDLNQTDKLFLYKNIYYLNHYKKSSSDLVQNTSWGICQFEKIGLNLFSVNITNEQDFKLLFDTTKTWQSIFPVAHISNKQFKNFVDKGGFHQKFRLIKYAH